MVKETREGRKEETNKVTEMGSKGGGERRVTEFREIKVRGEG